MSVTTLTVGLEIRNVAMATGTPTAVKFAANTTAIQVQPVGGDVDVRLETGTSAAKYTLFDSEPWDAAGAGAFAGKTLWFDGATGVTVQFIIMNGVTG